MYDITEMIDAGTDIPSIIDIEEHLAAREGSILPVLELTVLRNVVIEPIEPYLRYFADGMGFAAKVHLGQFDNLLQEAIDGAPELLHKDIDVVFVFAPLSALSPLLDRQMASLSSVQIEEEIMRLKTLFNAIVDGIRKQTGAMILWHGIETPVFPTLGIQDAQLPFGQAATTRLLNDALREKLGSIANGYLVSMDACLSRLGARRFYDPRYWLIAKSPYARDGLAEIAHEDFKFIKALKGKTKKCLVLDCDNTIWGGVVGEDGLDGIKLGQDYPGLAYIEFQKEIVSLYHRGVIVTICSKNNEADVWEVFEKHPDMVIGRKHIAAWRINWGDKAENLREIASELNIGMDSLVFVDDSDFEINLVRARASEVRTIQLPKDRPALYRWILASSGVFDLPRLTDEDRSRGRLYEAEVQRRREHSETVDLESYYRSLDMKVEIGYADSYSIPRIAQQTQKTNQFNLTTRRYSEADISQFANSKHYDVFWIRVADRFGDMGIVGTCVLRYEATLAIVDTLLVSCRVLGRGVEELFLNEIMRAASRYGAHTLLGEHIPSAKNSQVADFFPRNGFIPTSRLDGKGSWFSFDLTKTPMRDMGAFSSVHFRTDQTAVA